MKHGAAYGALLTVAEVGLATAYLATVAFLRCSGDTDDCTPSWVNDALLAGVVVAGVIVAGAVSLHLRRLDCAGRLSDRAMYVLPVVAAVGLIVVYSVVDAILPP